MKERLRANAGLTHDEVALLAKYIPEEEVKKRKDDLKKLREKVDDKFGTAMRFYDMPISEERKNELKDQVAMKRRLVSQAELEKKYKDLNTINDTFNDGLH